MRQLYRFTFLALLSCGLLTSCGEDETHCGEYVGPELVRNANGGCYYIDEDGSTVTITEAKRCRCAK